MKDPRIALLRFLLLLSLLLLTGVFLRSRSRPEVLPSRNQLSSFPAQVAEWKGRELVITDETRRILGDGEFLHRIYTSSPETPAVDFFLAYFPSQRTGSTIHSPKNCLPGAGWVPVESGHMPLRKPDGQTIIVNRYIIARGTDRQLVLYWYQSHGRVVASEYLAKFYLVADAIRMNRSDGGLVRMITPLGRSETADAGLQRAEMFAHSVLPSLESYIPR
ncbi:MAG: exosortase C-terminal domain/associated protein EpsI [Lysobacterales bacterium]